MPSYRIAILCVGEVSLHTALLAAEPFRAVNRLSPCNQFEIEFLGQGNEPLKTMIGIPLPARPMALAEPPFDLIFVLACYETVDIDRTTLFAWLRVMRQKGAMIAGLDLAPLLMAEAGLLGNRQVTSHMTTRDAFAERHPHVRVCDALFIIDRNIATCAGQIATLDLSMTLLRRVVSTAMYKAVQDELVYTPREGNPEGQASPVTPDESMADRLLAGAQSLMHAHIEDPLPITEIARQVGSSERELQRRFQRRLGRSPADFYRDLRLRKAMDLLQYSSLTIREIGIATGFADPSAFYRGFRNRFGKGPQDWRSSFNAEPSFPNGRRVGFVS